jgi:hypothetical protein
MFAYHERDPQCLICWQLILDQKHGGGG